MQPPFDFVPRRVRRPLFLAALLWALILLAILQVLNQPLVTTAAPNGIVSLELAATPERARDILASWTVLSPAGPASSPRTFALLFDAAFGLGLDYLFMPSYAAAIALGVLLAAGRHRGWLAALGAWAGWGSVLAALFDAVENLALWHIVRNMSFISPWPQLSFVCASVKFALIAIGILYALIGALLPGEPRRLARQER